MTNEELTFERGAGDDPREAVQAQLTAQFAAALEIVEAKAEEDLELGQTPPFTNHWWNIWATGPRPWNAALAPGRIIQKNEWSVIHTVVWMNPLMCTAVAGFGAKIQLDFYTSDMQRMEVAGPELTHSCCFEVKVGKCWYEHFWWFKTDKPACLYETNICAHICNCEDKPVPQYGAYVKHVYDWDPEFIWPLEPPTGPHFHPADWHYDHPIRFMVIEGPCDCKENPPC